LGTSSLTSSALAYSGRPRRIRSNISRTFMILKRFLWSRSHRKKPRLRNPQRICQREGPLRRAS